MASFNRRRRNRGLSLSTLLVTLLIHAALILFLNKRMRESEVWRWIKDDVISIYIEPPPLSPKPARRATNARPMPLPPAPIPAEIPLPMDLPPAPEPGPPAERPAPAAPAMVSDLGTLDNVDFAPLYNPAPAYPEIARAAGIEGYVLIELTIDEKGRVRDHEIRGVVGHPQFAEETERIIRQWRFPPPRLNGRPACVRYLYKVIFRLG